MKITILTNKNGSDDGINIRSFKEGETVTVGEDLGGVFVREGWAVEAKPEPEKVTQPGPTETKPAKGPKERKS